MTIHSHILYSILNFLYPEPMCPQPKIATVLSYNHTPEGKWIVKAHSIETCPGLPGTTLENSRRPAKGAKK